MSFSVQIPIVADVEGVGKNLQDHPLVPVLFAVNDRTAFTITQLVDPPQFYKYVTRRTGKMLFNYIQFEQKKH